ncbi:gluconokinase [Paenibacillus yonginensis]|uniref:Gluconokinase n=1 Tax=Paenibacillus yonginensis TaxID=1462996 RepID=A0A1B1MXM3_9BACL|nr:FGGY family carbohydrate kinase [Paenibacillus yonginensis]ANS73931.1 gluconokinase [Paenibacillus yonginensis]
MKQDERVLGLDIGTTSLKAVLFGPNGTMMAKHSSEYPLYQPQQDWAEQDPEEILQALVDAVRHVLLKSKADPKKIIAIGFSAAMHSLIALDADGQPLTRSLVWTDNRSTSQAERLKQHGGHDIYLRTGTPIHPMSPLCKLLWMKEEDPETFQKSAMFVGIKEYLLFRLFGTYIMDYSMASATGMFELSKLDWDEGALKLLELERSRLPQPVPTTHILEGMNQTLAGHMGLDPQTPVVVGASDGVLANLGVGAMGEGEVAVTIGTSGAVRMMTDKPLTDGQQRTFCYALTERHWVVGGPTNNGGIMLRWLRDQFGSPEVEVAKRLNIDPYDLMIQYAEKVPAGAEGLLFLPFLTGERAPIWNPDARGLFFGISLRHQREHFIRAVLEGVIFSIFSIGVALRDLAGPATKIIASGGFARSAVWRQILSDVMGKELLVPEVEEASALGAAAIALYGVKDLEALEDVKHWVRISETHKPNLQNSEVYLQLFDMYERLYSKLKSEFQVMAEFQRTGGFMPTPDQ